MNPAKSIVSVVLTLIILVAAFVLIPAVVYVVDEREMAVVLQFGDPVAERTEPGFYFKTPFIQEVRKLPKTRQFWGNQLSDELPDLPTKDDKKIEVIPWAVWRVSEPTVFVQRLRTMENAQQRIAQFVRGAIRDVATQYDLAELVRSTDRKLNLASELDVDAKVEQKPDSDAQESPGDSSEELVIPKAQEVPAHIKHGRLTILARIKSEAQRRLAAGLGEEEGGRGIEMIDIGISQIEFVESVRRETFNRWIAERQAIAALQTNEGERLKQEILNKTAAEVEKIEGEGQKMANTIRGNADAKIIKDYAEAIEEAGDFYTFVRTLEAYEKSISTDTRLILTTDSAFLQLLKRLEPEPRESAKRP